MTTSYIYKMDENETQYISPQSLYLNIFFDEERFILLKSLGLTPGLCITKNYSLP
jgi:hypothetical protein